MVILSLGGLSRLLKPALASAALALLSTRLRAQEPSSKSSVDSQTALGAQHPALSTSSLALPGFVESSSEAVTPGVLGPQTLSPPPFTLPPLGRGQENANQLFNPETLIIQDVLISGLKHVKESLIRSQVKTRKGDVFDSLDAKADIKRLMNLGPFSSVNIQVSTMTAAEKTYLRVDFQCEEKPKIKKVSITGANMVSKSSIREILAPARQDEAPAAAPGPGPAAFPNATGGDLRTEIDEGAYFDEAKLAVSIQKIKAKYEEKSIFGSTIETVRKIDAKTGKLDLELKIKEGLKARVAVVHFEGFESYPLAKIKRTVKIKTGKVLDAKKIKQGYEQVNELYKEAGWLDFTVDLSSRAATDDEIKTSGRKWKKTEMPVTLKYAAVEGRRHFLLNYSITGNQAFTESELRRLFSLPLNQVLKESSLREAREAILNAYRDRGYLFAVIEEIKNWRGEPANGLELVFKIEERGLVHIGKIFIEGLVKTKEHVIRREILLKEGDLFSSKKLYKSTDKIYNLGFIEEVRPDYDPSSEPGKVDLIFDVKEGRPGMLTAGAGFSSIDGVVGTVSLQHLNMLGYAQHLNLSSEFGKRRKTYDVTWTSPWTFNRRMSSSLSLFNTNRSLQYATDTTGFKKRSKGGSLFFAPRFDEDLWTLGAGYGLQDDTIYDVLPIYRNQIEETVIRRSAITTRVSHDTRDFLWDPKRGAETTLSAEFVGGPVGGDVHFVKPNLTHTMHVPTLSLGRYTFVLSAALRWGFVQPYSRAGFVPVSDRYFVGGAETVRGYSYTGQIGPIEGGKAFGVANIEYKLPLLLEGRFTIIQFALFTDIGGAWRGMRDVNLNFGRELNNLKAGIGFGLRFKTPAFPVRLDWGWGLHHQPGESISQFYFTIGSIL